MWLLSFTTRSHLLQRSMQRGFSLFSDVHLLPFFGNKAGLQSVDYSTCVAYTTTNIHLSVSESGGCLPDLG